jgi:peptide chain release factor 1
VVVELQAGEGGEDSKLFVHDLFAAYVKYGNSLNQSEILESSKGSVTAKFWGEGAGKAFQEEGGKHIVQRIPPTEKRDRRQTSVVIVVVLPMLPDLPQLDEKDIEMKFQGGHGKGGQHQNVTDSAVRMKHIPTELSVFINGRDQHANRREALRILAAKVHEHYTEKQNAEFGKAKKQQIDGGGRGNKIRTYNFIKSRAVDHRTGKKTKNVRAVIERGRFDLLR